MQITLLKKEKTTMATSSLQSLIDARGTKRRVDEISTLLGLNTSTSSILSSLSSGASATKNVDVDETEDSERKQQQQQQRTRFESKAEAEYWTCVPGPLASQCVSSRQPGFEQEWAPRFRRNNTLPTYNDGSSSSSSSNDSGTSGFYNGSSIYSQYPTQQQCESSCLPRRMPHIALWNMAPMLNVQDLESLKRASTREIAKELQQTAAANKLRQDVLRQVHQLKALIEDSETEIEITLKAFNDLWKLLIFASNNIIIGSVNNSKISKSVTNLFTAFSAEISREIVDAALSYPTPGDGYESAHFPQFWLGIFYILLKLNANNPKWIIPNESRLRILVASPEGKDLEERLQQKMDLVGAGLMNTIDPLNLHDQENVVFALQKALSLDSEAAAYERKVLYKNLIPTDQTVSELWSSKNLFYVPEQRPESKRTMLEALVAKWKKIGC